MKKKKKEGEDERKVVAGCNLFNPLSSESSDHRNIKSSKYYSYCVLSPDWSELVMVAADWSELGTDRADWSEIREIIAWR